MAHPFEKIFAKALKESTEFDNVVLEAAEALLEKGYARTEIATVLRAYAQGLIDPVESSIVAEAHEAIAAGLDEA